MSDNKNSDNHADREPGKGAGGQHENPSTGKSANQQNTSQAAAGGESDDASDGSGMSRRQALKYIGIGAGALVAGGAIGGYGYTRSLRIPAREAARIKNVRFVVAGGSVGGLTVAARLLRAMPEANVTVIEPNAEHHYQPGYTLVGAGVYTPEEAKWKQKDLMHSSMKWVHDAVAHFEPDRNRVVTAGGDVVEYDYLVVGLGVQMNPNSVENFHEALESNHVATIYDLDQSIKYNKLMQDFRGGQLVATYPRGYVKCGGAPQKITWLSEDYWRTAGIRDKVEVDFYTERHTLFPPVPDVDRAVTPLVEARGIRNHYHHNIKAIDVKGRVAIFEELHPDGVTREVRKQYDLLHLVPGFRTPQPVREGPLTREGIGGQLSVDRETLQHTQYPNIFGIGDGAATGAAKTAATIRKQAPVVVANMLDMALDREPVAKYDGASGCPLLTRYGRCMMFEFDYEGNLVNEWIYNSTKETRMWWQFKVHGLKRLYRHAMLNGYV